MTIAIDGLLNRLITAMHHLNVLIQIALLRKITLTIITFKTFVTVNIAVGVAIISVVVVVCELMIELRVINGLRRRHWRWIDWLRLRLLLLMLL